MESHRIASVIPLRSARNIDRYFDYICDGFSDIKRGDLVTIPFGKDTANVYGLVDKVKEEVPSMKLKEIHELLDNRFSISDELCDLISFMKRQCFCTLTDGVRSIIPSGIRLKALNRYEFVDQNDFLSFSKNEESTGAKVFYNGHSIKLKQETISELIREKRIIQTTELIHSVNEKELYFYSPSRNTEKEERLRASQKQKYALLLDFFKSNKDDGATSSDILDKTGISRSTLESLAEKGLLKKEKTKVFRSSYNDSFENNENITLNDEQKLCFSEISSAVNENKAQAFLLHGVTGSGKTKVLLKVIDAILAKNKSVIYLIPEISLTSQSFKLLSERYRDKVAVIHSGISEGERADAWLKIKSGEKKVVLGTRSAVFSPCVDLGAIIIDEEHDQSYKSDSSPRYHARDIARFRCAKNNALMILSSATPDIESYHKAQTGKYKLLTLKKRYSLSPLPSVKIEDIRRELRDDPEKLIGRQLESQIELNLENKEQTILFVDRRGYRRFISCIECSNVPTCPNCSVSLTLHSGRSEVLTCHYCGYSIPAPKTCPKCSGKLHYHGYGSQKVEEELKKLFPDASILRMDADTVNEKMGHHKILTKFREEKADILLGTQMVVKGHDFPLVTLVGVIMADSSLYMSDYRAYEHCFSLLTQVVGRAGRSNLPGRAVIQTLNPYHELFSFSVKQDYPSFYQSEINMRRALVFPPFCNICVFNLACENEDMLNAAVKDFSKQLEDKTRKVTELKLIVYGPFEAPIYKLNNVYRKRFLIKYKPTSQASQCFGELLDKFSKQYRDKININIDINPALV